MTRRPARACSGVRSHGSTVRSKAVRLDDGTTRYVDIALR
jgi:hypothetical protein